MTVRTLTARSLAVLALAPLAASFLVLSAAPALASGSYSGSTPAAGAVLTTNRFSVQASIAAGSDSATLTVTGTAQGASAPFCTASTSGSGGALSGAQTLTLAFPTSSGSCAAVRNAQWLANLSGGATGSRSFTTNAPPATPGNFSAQGSGARDVSFTWTRGPEADLQGFALYDGSGTVIDGAIDLSHCSGSSCAYGLYYPSDNAGTHDYQLSALRASGGCGGCGSSLESAKTSATATLVNPPKPTPSPTPAATAGPTAAPAAGGTSGGAPAGSSTGGSPGGSSSGTTPSSGSTTSGGTAVKPGPKPTLPTLANPILAARNAFALQFNAFAPSLGIPKLPPLPATALPSFSGEGPLPTGTYKPTLPYQPQSTTEKSTSVLSQPISAVRDVLDSAQLARSIAVAFILLMAGAHLRRFLGSHVED